MMNGEQVRLAGGLGHATAEDAEKSQDARLQELAVNQALGPSMP